VSYKEIVLRQFPKRDGIELTIWSQKRYYDEDETVFILVSIKNKRKQEARLYPTEKQAALEVTYSTNFNEVAWHEGHPEIAFNDIVIDPGEIYQLEISIPPDQQPGNESGRLCAGVQVNYPGGWNGSYGLNTCHSYNNKPY
jgi:hypothetical protein